MLAQLLLMLSLHQAELPQRPQLQLIGEAELKVWIWPIYQAQLLSQSGDYAPNQYPLQLSLNYLRDIERQQLLDNTAKEWQRLNICSLNPCQPWLNQLDELWPDIRRGDRLELYAPSPDTAHFYFNGDYLGALQDTGFSEHFLAIWLSRDSRYPKQRRKLIGED